MKIKHEREISILQELAGKFLSIESNYTSLITVTAIDLTPKADRAIIKITVFPTDKEDEAIEFLKRMRSDFRKFVMENSKIARVPMFDFAIDKGEKNRQKVEEGLQS